MNTAYAAIDRNAVAQSSGWTIGFPGLTQILEDLKTIITEVLGEAEVFECDEPGKDRFEIMIFLAQNDDAQQVKNRIQSLLGEKGYLPFFDSIEVLSAPSVD